MWPRGPQHTRFLCPLLSFRACSNLHGVSDAIQPSHPLSLLFPLALNLSQDQGFFPLSWLFASSGQSIGASASASVLPVNIQCWFPLGLTDLVSFLCICAHIMKTFELQSLIVWYVTYFNKTITKENLWPSIYDNELYNI